MHDKIQHTKDASDGSKQSELKDYDAKETETK